MEALLAVLQPHGPSSPVAQQGGRRGRQPQVREGREASSLGLPGAGLMAKRGGGAARHLVVTDFEVGRQCFKVLQFLFH